MFISFSVDWIWFHGIQSTISAKKIQIHLIFNYFNNSNGEEAENEHLFASSISLQCDLFNDIKWLNHSDADSMIDKCLSRAVFCVYEISKACHKRRKTKKEQRKTRLSKIVCRSVAWTRFVIQTCWGKFKNEKHSSQIAILKWTK